jgi:hypothetical protein
MNYNRSERLATKKIKDTANAYLYMAFGACVLIMLGFGYESARLDVVLICIVLAAGALGESAWLLYQREKALITILATAQRRELTSRSSDKHLADEPNGAKLATKTPHIRRYYAQ